MNRLSFLLRVPGRLLRRPSLRELACRFEPDKDRGHHYIPHYQHHFGPWRNKKISLLEIGIGGYENPREGGESLRMWKAYFPAGHIFGIDLYDKSCHDEPRIKTYQGDQTDTAFLRGVAKETGPLDIIIDDGSHVNDHVITCFKTLFPLLSERGIYVVEDLQTSYWEEVAGIHWGGSKQREAPHTSMHFFKSLVDGLQYEEFTMENYIPTYFDTHVVAMHFYHNLVFIYKGRNNEGSNILKKRGPF
jgi:hypothetical protein